MRLFPCPILSQPHFSVAGIIEINLTDVCLNKSPSTPVETRNAPKEINFFKQLLNFRLVERAIEEGVVGSKIIRQEISALLAGRKDGVVAVEATPLGEVVCDVECGRCRRGVFVVNEVDGRNWMF